MLPTELRTGVGSVNPWNRLHVLALWFSLDTASHGISSASHIARNTPANGPSASTTTMRGIPRRTKEFCKTSSAMSSALNPLFSLVNAKLVNPGKAICHGDGFVFSVFTQNSTAGRPNVEKDDVRGLAGLNLKACLVFVQSVISQHAMAAC